MPRDLDALLPLARAMEEGKREAGRALILETLRTTKGVTADAADRLTGGDTGNLQRLAALCGLDLTAEAKKHRP